jgi:hypothetical protein
MVGVRFESNMKITVLRDIMPCVRLRTSNMKEAGYFSEALIPSCHIPEDCDLRIS